MAIFGIWGWQLLRPAFRFQGLSDGAHEKASVVVDGFLKASKRLLVASLGLWVYEWAG